MGLDPQGSMAGEARVSSQVLDQLRRLVVEATPEDLPRLAGALEEARARCWARLWTPGSANGRTGSGSAREEARGAKLLTAQEAATLADVSPRWLRRNTKGLRFRHDLSRKLVRFDEAGFLRWLQARRGLTGN